MEEKTLLKNMGDFYINCPHCDEIVYITKVKCAMFLHAASKNTSKTLNAHTKWYEVDKLKRHGLLLGCGERFWVKMDESGTIVSVTKPVRSRG